MCIIIYIINFPFFFFMYLICNHSRELNDNWKISFKHLLLYEIGFETNPVSNALVRITLLYNNTLERFCVTKILTTMNTSYFISFN